VENFGIHGLQEDNTDSGENLETISIKHKQRGVFPMFAEKTGYRTECAGKH
jgi:hypothetical protein